MHSVRGACYGFPMTQTTTSAREYFPRLLAAEAAAEPFRAGNPGAHLLVPSEAYDAMKAERDAARAEVAGLFCTLCGGTGHINTRPDPELYVTAGAMLDWTPAGGGGAVGACYRCDGSGWSPAGYDYAQAELGLVPDRFGRLVRP